MSLFIFLWNLTNTCQNVTVDICQTVMFDKFDVCPQPDNIYFWHFLKPVNILFFILMRHLLIKPAKILFSENVYKRKFWVQN